MASAFAPSSAASPAGPAARSRVTASDETASSSETALAAKSFNSAASAARTGDAYASEAKAKVRTANGWMNRLFRITPPRSLW